MAPARWAPVEGSVMTYVERPETAILVMQRLAENADDVDALFVLAAMEAQEGRVVEGLKILEYVLHLAPAYPGGWRFKATLHRMTGDVEAELAAWERADASEE
jgi:tetratricopeptide (TPR) repeat protein